MRQDHAASDVLTGAGSQIEPTCGTVRGSQFDYETDEVRATQPRVTPDGLDVLYTSVTADHRVPALMPVFGGQPIEVVQSGTFTHPVRQPGECPADIGCGTFP